MKKHFLIPVLIAIAVASLVGCSSTKYNSDTPIESGAYNAHEDNRAEEPSVKMSSSGICHRKGSTYYDKTKNFTPYDSIDECLDDGGRLPKK